MKPIESLSELQGILTRLLFRIDEACKAWGIRYSLAGGTLLGAARHKGFIPWDDDVDIAMPRKDYERFLEMAGKEGDRYHFGVVSPKTDPAYPSLYSKAFDPDTLCVESNLKSKGVRYGCFVDVFPIDGLGKAKDAGRHIAKKRLPRLILTASAWKKYRKSLNRPWYREPIRLLFYCLSRGVDPVKLSASITRYYERFDLEESEVGAVVVGARSKKDALPARSFLEYTTLEFGGRQLSVFKDYDFHLRAQYGDYMRLPPKEKQITHHSFDAFILEEKDK